MTKLPRLTISVSGSSASLVEGVEGMEGVSINASMAA